jgi:RNA polymerase sigma-70 factor (sigma-E family)
MTQYGWAERKESEGDENRDRMGCSEHRLMAAEVPRSFELAFADLYTLAYRVAYRILGDRPEAQDVAQEALARATVRWDKLHDRPEGWVSRVASNLALDRYRKRRRRRSLAQTGPVGIVDDQTVERSDLVIALRRLPRRQREVVVLRYLADFSEKDVASALGCSIGSVKTHASRGLSGLRRHLGHPETGGGDDVRAS